MAGVRLDVFKGIRPRVAKRLLPAGEARTAQNTQLSSGHLEPLNGHDELKQAHSSLVQTIYRMRNNGDPLWLQFEKRVDVVRGPVPDDDVERTYYTGENQPRMTTTALVGATDPLPADYRYLGIPAPETAPTVSGQELPADAITGTTEGFTTPSLKADFTIDQGLPNEVNSWYMALTDGGEPSDNGYEPDGTSRTYRFDVPVGLRLRVANVVDENTITIEDEGASGFVFAGVDDSRSGQTWWRTEDVGTTRAGFFRFYMPSGTKVTITDHGLKAGDIIRVTAVTSPIAITFTAPASITETGGHFFGWESDNTGGSESTNTWPSAPTSSGADSFFYGGPKSYPFVDIFVDQDGASSSNSFSIDGQFSFQLVERDGVAYDDIVSNIESRVYVYTFVSDLGEEGPPSPASTIVTIPSDGSVTVGSFETPPSEKRNITHMRIYRANTGSEVTEFQFVAEIASPFSDYLDEIADIDLGEVLQTTTWEPPPADLTGLVALPNGVLAGFVGKTVYFSEPYHPHAWPPEYKLAVDHDIVGLGVLPNGAAILTTGAAYIAAGDHPRSMSLRHFATSQACVSKRSIVSTIDSVIYASPDGLASIGAGGFQLLTEKHCTKKEWQEFSPTELQGFWHDNKYYGFNQLTGFIFDAFDTSVGLTTLDFSIICGYLDAEDDVLYGIPVASVGAGGTFYVTVAKRDPQNVFGWEDPGVFGPIGSVDPYPPHIPSSVSPNGTVEFAGCVSHPSTPQGGVSIILVTSDLADANDPPTDWEEIRCETASGEFLVYPIANKYSTTSGPPVSQFTIRTDVGGESPWSNSDVGEVRTVHVVGEGGQISSLFTDTTSPIEFTWRSGDLVMPYPLNPAAARVLADVYPVTFNLYDATGTLRASRSVTNSNVFRLPGGYLTDAMSVEVVASGPVRMIYVAETVEELFAG